MTCSNNVRMDQELFRYLSISHCILFHFRNNCTLVIVNEVTEIAMFIAWSGSGSDFFHTTIHLSTGGILKSELSFSAPNGRLCWIEMISAC